MAVSILIFAQEQQESFGFLFVFFQCLVAAIGIFGSLFDNNYLPTVAEIDTERPKFSSTSMQSDLSVGPLVSITGQNQSESALVQISDRKSLAAAIFAMTKPSFFLSLSVSGSFELSGQIEASNLYAQSV
jgi:hypothetical protein